MRVRILVPPNDTLLCSMLYEGYLRIASVCGEEAGEDCVKRVLKELGEGGGGKEEGGKAGEKWEKEERREVDFRFAGNDAKYTLGKLSKTLGVEIGSFRDLMNALAATTLTNLEIDVKLSKGAVLVGAPGFTDEKKGYSFQIMKADRYMGISSIESRTFREDITTYADLSGLAVFFAGLASSYVTRVAGGRDYDDYYFLFFDTDTLLNRVLGGNVRWWMDTKDSLSAEIRKKIDEYGGIDDAALTLTVLYNVRLLEELERSQVRYVGFRLVQVRGEGRPYKAYKIYADMPFRVYPRREISREEAKEINEIVDTLARSASRFTRGRDETGEGYHAFKALRYLYTYVTTENPSYLAMMYRELHEAYLAAERSGSPNAGVYLRCFLRHTAGY